VEDGLSECETILACLDYDGNGHNFDDGIGIDFEDEGSG
jgi:hypothetical protein